MNIKQYINRRAGTIMKQSRDVVEGRRAQILNMVTEEQDVKVEALAERFGTSEMTIRRDLQYLSERKLIMRTFGGAEAMGKDAGQKIRETYREYFDEMARMAADMIDDGDTIFINGSMTALAILDHVGDKRVRAITNNIHAMFKKYPANVEIDITGGKLEDHVLIGIDTIRYLSEIEADKTFMGCARVYANGEFGYNIPTEIAINEVMAGCTKGELVLMADHTKLFYHSYDLDEDQYGSFSLKRSCKLITDELADYDVVEGLRRHGIEVLLAKKSSR